VTAAGQLTGQLVDHRQRLAHRGCDPQTVIDLQTPVRGVSERVSGERSSDVTRRHYVDRAVDVPDYTAALDSYSRRFRAVEADSGDDAGEETASEMG
jgi:hypothetical protein